MTSQLQPPTLAINLYMDNLASSVFCVKLFALSLDYIEIKTVVSISDLLLM